MPQASLETFPNELVVLIADLLSFDDLAHLCRTCTRMSTIVGPRIWNSIEFHTVTYHMSSAELNEPPPFMPISQQAYHSTSGRRRGQVQQAKAEMFVNTLQECHANDQNRLRELCSRVKNVCTGVDCMWGRRGAGEERILVWHLLPYFTDLETLELHGDCLNEQSCEQIMGGIVGAPLPRLRFAKLFAYIPREVARWVLKSGPSLERLELGLLDRPISSCVGGLPKFKPLVEEKLDPDSDNDSNDDESDFGSLNGEAVIPRPLGCLFTDNLEPNLPRLRVMYLLSTTASPKQQGTVEYTWSTRAQEASLSDWRRLLLACSGTLETLVLEQRPGADLFETDEICEQDYPRLNQDGSINRELVHLVQRLLGEKDALPALQRVYLYGFAVGENGAGRPSDTAYGGQLMLDLERHGLRCEARLGKWCLFDSGPGYVFWCDWDDENVRDDDEDMQTWDTLLAQV
ncbi:hypothetical protein AK830_g273 [Neonectria ditissima]|uniref:F-box domain-containing protein n=1 Tax=Neonectria ditissima TaxID=78410 RepID=A0A0P7C2P8_9HYPO|nr:hypothetical protein AK830_g273 [Neonectria ditissima]